ncbi:polysaccharide deacetylase family protein [Brucella intermedia]|uniref:polysaccharide deacetylase family protein n=1 Tax=Brucella TaxID=234 RepID=UPI0009464E30
MSKSILMYHQIDKVNVAGSPFRGLNVSPENFASQMKWLARLGYRGLSLCEMEPFITGEKTGKVFGLTFDDGFENVYQHALPVLRKYGFSATCFFVSGQIGGFNSWDQAVGIPYTACMSKSQVLDWVRAGNEVGAHTVDHVRLPDVQPAEAFRQIRESKAQLEGLIEADVRAFCYPYGAVSRNIRDMVAKAGFKIATTTQRGCASATHDRLLLPRRNVRHCNGWLSTVKKAVWG